MTCSTDDFCGFDDADILDKSSPSTELTKSSTNEFDPSPTLESCSATSLSVALEPVAGVVDDKDVLFCTYAENPLVRGLKSHRIDSYCRRPIGLCPERWMPSCTC